MHDAHWLSGSAEEEEEEDEDEEEEEEEAEQGEELQEEETFDIIAYLIGYLPTGTQACCDTPRQLSILLDALEIHAPALLRYFATSPQNIPIFIAMLGSAPLPDQYLPPSPTARREEHKDHFGRLINSLLFILPSNNSFKDIVLPSRIRCHLKNYFRSSNGVETEPELKFLRFARRLSRSAGCEAGFDEIEATIKCRDLDRWEELGSFLGEDVLEMIREEVERPAIGTSYEAGAALISSQGRRFYVPSSLPIVMAATTTLALAILAGVKAWDALYKHTSARDNDLLRSARLLLKECASGTELSFNLVPPTPPNASHVRTLYSFTERLSLELRTNCPGIELLGPLLRHCYPNSSFSFVEISIAPFLTKPSPLSAERFDAVLERTAEMDDSGERSSIERIAGVGSRLQVEYSALEQRERAIGARIRGGFESTLRLLMDKTKNRAIDAAVVSVLANDGKAPRPGTLSDFINLVGISSLSEDALEELKRRVWVVWYGDAPPTMTRNTRNKTLLSEGGAVWLEAIKEGLILEVDYTAWKR